MTKLEVERLVWNDHRFGGRRAYIKMNRGERLQLNQSRDGRVLTRARQSQRLSRNPRQLDRLSRHQIIDMLLRLKYTLMQQKTKRTCLRRRSSATRSKNSSISTGLPSAFCRMTKRSQTSLVSSRSKRPRCQSNSNNTGRLLEQSVATLHIARHQHRRQRCRSLTLQRQPLEPA